MFYSIQTCASNNISEQRDRELQGWAVSIGATTTCVAARPLHNHAFESGGFFARKARCPFFKFVQETLDPLLRSLFPDIEIASFDTFISAHILAVVSSGTLIETIISPPGCKLFYCAEMPQFLQAVGSNGLPQHTQFSYALANLSFLTYVPGGAPEPPGHSLPLLCSASFSALALVHASSVSLLRPVSSILLSFSGDASPSVFS